MLPTQIVGYKVLYSNIISITGTTDPCGAYGFDLRFRGLVVR
jgi:hypothetical protein